MIAIGLELYTVNAEMQKDFDGTLRQVAAIGYRRVELPGLYDRSALEVRKSLDAVGLACDSVMFTAQALQPNTINLQDHLPQCIEAAQTLGAKYVGCPVPFLPRFTQGDEFTDALETLTRDDYKRNADHFNKIGAQIRKAGLQFVYHNHDLEFREFDGVPALDELLRLTNPELVGILLDCGWVVAAGHDPIAYLRKYPGRIPVLHLKDLERQEPKLNLKMTSMELGRGIIDWRKVLDVGQETGVKAGFVEQEPPFVRPAIEAAKISYQHLQSLGRV